jgi:hypothetical protein
VRPACRPAQAWWADFLAADAYEQAAARDQHRAVIESMTGAW